MARSMAVSSAALHPVLALVVAFTVTGTMAVVCENTLGDDTCEDHLSQANFCWLTKTVRCGCQKDCYAKPKCGGVPGDDDTMCDCPFYAHRCDDPDMAWYWDFCNFTCFRRNTVVCDPLETLEGASPTNSAPGYMDAVDYECDPGWYQVNGSLTRANRRVCTADGSWLKHPDYHDPDLLCARNSCGPVPVAPALTAASLMDGVFEDAVTYSCVVGYANTGSGQGTHTCNASALWERVEVDPVCTPVQCGSPPAADNAAASATSGAYLSTIAYSCLPGYERSGDGDGVKRCNATGLWEPVEADPDIVCTAKSCGAPPFVSGATPSSPTGFYTDHVTYTCKPNYNLIGGGTGQVTCEVDGFWHANTTHDPVPLCLGAFVKFVNSESEILPPTTTVAPDSWTSTTARSKLHCASFCAASVRCHGYSFTESSGDCSMNSGSRLPVLTRMKKVYE